jgi:hypothetical protein
MSNFMKIRPVGAELFHADSHIVVYCHGSYISNANLYEIF